jgi:predicted glycosyltransferase involved in capsule biosynthesis
MKKERLNRYLNSVGKECFVNYFELFSDDNIQNNEIAERIHNDKGYTVKACNSRTGHARMIIREGGAEEALRVITESKRLEIGIIKQAEKHLKNIT